MNVFYVYRPHSQWFGSLFGRCTRHIPHPMETVICPRFVSGVSQQCELWSAAWLQCTHSQLWTHFTFVIAIYTVPQKDWDHIINDCNLDIKVLKIAHIFQVVVNQLDVSTEIFKKTAA